MYRFIIILLLLAIIIIKRKKKCKQGFTLIPFYDPVRGHKTKVEEVRNRDGKIYEAPIVLINRLRKEIDVLVGNYKDTLELCVCGELEIIPESNNFTSKFVLLQPSTKHITLANGENITLTQSIKELINIIEEHFPDVLRNRNSNCMYSKAMDHPEHGKHVLGLLSVANSNMMPNVKTLLQSPFMTRTLIESFSMTILPFILGCGGWQTHLRSQE